MVYVLTSSNSSGTLTNPKPAGTVLARHASVRFPAHELQPLARWRSVLADVAAGDDPHPEASAPRAPQSARSANRETKHSDVSKRLRSEIAAGVYGPGTRLPGESQLVKRFQVSRPTIGRALQDLQTEGLIERRAGSGTYVRSEVQSPVAARLLGLMVPGLGTEMTPEMLCGEFATLARTGDYSLLRGTTRALTGDMDACLKEEEAICRQFIERQVAGVFLAPRDLPEERSEHNVR